MINLWQTFFIQPLEVSLIFLNGFLGNLGLAIVVLTIIIQLILVPLRMPSLKSAKKIQSLKPKLDELKEKHKEDKQALMKAQMDLYKAEGVSPLGGFLPTLLSLPIIIALYQVLSKSLGTASIGEQFLWLNLKKPDPYFILPALTAISQWFLSKMMMSQNQPAAVSPKANNTSEPSLEDSMMAAQKQMQFLFPLFSAFLVLSLPSGVGLYWIISLVFAIVQQWWVGRMI